MLILKLIFYYINIIYEIICIIFLILKYNILKIFYFYKSL